MNTTMFHVRNRANQVVTGQAIPSITPGLAALNLHQTECFCFTQQSRDRTGNAGDLLCRRGTAKRDQYPEPVVCTFQGHASSDSTAGEQLR